MEYSDPGNASGNYNSTIEGLHSLNKQLAKKLHELIEQTKHDAKQLSGFGLQAIGEQMIKIKECLKSIKKTKDLLGKDLNIISELEIEYARIYANLSCKITGKSLKSLVSDEKHKTIRKTLSLYFGSTKVAQVKEAIINKTISWDRKLTKEDCFGRGMDERVIEFPLAIEITAADRPGLVLDAGFGLNAIYVEDFTQNPAARIIKYTQSSEKEEHNIHYFKDKLSYMFGDLRSMEFKDEIFDRIICLSTLEHVGMNNSRYEGPIESDPGSALDAVKEMRRVLKQGSTLFISVPYGASKLCDWFRYMDHNDIREIIATFKPSSEQVKYYYNDDSYWYEGNCNPPVSFVPDPGYVRGLAAIKLIR